MPNDVGSPQTSSFNTSEHHEAAPVITTPRLQGSLLTLHKASSPSILPLKMRLLHSKTLEMEEFSERDTPHYAILSHTWGKGEVLLADMREKRASSLPGYQKVLACCKQAQQDGLTYVWIDTCCIDKTSSTELAEAINSMFTWYQKAIVCYAYLEDIQDIKSLGESRWVTRGWTLQELIAPCVLVFYNSDWKEIGVRDDCAGLVSDVTSIDQDLLMHGELSRYSVAQRMSWAAKRETTRKEDEAYCLLGLFGVSMPLLYGEGKRAFIRLQEEIMKQYDDHPIFAWRMADNTAFGFLAPSPGCFAEAGSILKGEDQEGIGAPFHITNKGISITLPILQWNTAIPSPSFEPMSAIGDGPRVTVTPAEFTEPNSYNIAVLNCQTRTGQKVGLIIDRPEGTEQFHRVISAMGPFIFDPEECAGDAKLQTIMVKSHDSLRYDPLMHRLRSTFFSIQGLPRPETGFTVIKKDDILKITDDGVMSVNLSIGIRYRILFSDGSFSLGIFLAETWSASYWELATGTESEMLAWYDQSPTKHEKYLSSEPSWELMVGDLKTQGYYRKLSMETRRRPHGFSSQLEFGRSGAGRMGYSVRPRQGMRLSDSPSLFKESGSEGDWTTRRYPNRLQRRYDNPPEPRYQSQ